MYIYIVESYTYNTHFPRLIIFFYKNAKFNII